jgi:hypothetical protein
MNVEKKDWRKLCALVAMESDPQRLSELVDEIIKALDSRKQELQRSGPERNPTSVGDYDT